MTYALISNAGPSIQWVVPNFPNPFLLPDGTQEYPASLPWTSPDGAYTLVEVTPFATPSGQVNVGSPSYALVNGVVTETYQTASAPVVTPNPSAAYLTAIAAGLSITSTSTPAINGTYAIDANATANLNAVETYVLTNNTFPLGATQPWFLLNGTEVVIPNITVFKSLSSAIAQYVAALDVENDIALTGGTPTWPSASVTIA